MTGNPPVGSGSTSPKSRRSDPWPNTLTLRKLLAEILRTSSDFDAFCLDDFEAVHRQFGSGMDRTHSESLLFQLVPSREAIVAALRKRSPSHCCWTHWDAMQSSRAECTVTQPVVRSWRLRTGAVSATSLLLVAAALWVKQEEWKGMSRAQTSSVMAVHSTCGALAIDDVFVVKDSYEREPRTLLEIRLRNQHAGSRGSALNLSRVFIDCLDRTKLRAPLQVSALYDLLIDGPQSQAALAQQLVPGEVDRILLRVGFTPETAAYEYTAKLRVQYNGTCTAESLPFALSH